MEKKICIKFADTVDPDYIGHLLDCALVAVESIAGETRLKAEAGVNFDEEDRSIAIVVNGHAGEALRRALVGIVRDNFMDDEYSIRSCQVAGPDDTNGASEAAQSTKCIKVAVFAVVLA